MEGLLGFALIIGLFVAYAKERRAKRRAEEAAVAPQPAAVVVPESPPVAEPAASVPQPVSYGSPNWGAPIVFTVLLIAAATHVGSWWGILWQVLYLALVAVAAYSTFSPKELADEQRRRPGTTRRDTFLRIGIPYFVIPLVAWILAIPLGIHAATLLPAIPWVLLALLGAGAAIFARPRTP